MQINMCEEDLEALQRLGTIFARVAQTNSDVQIRRTPIRTPPRVQTKTPDQDTNKASTAALKELATQPRVQQTIFTDISKPAANPANETPSTNNRSRRKSRTLTQESILASIQLRQTEMNARTLVSRKFPRHMLNAVLNEDTGKLMEYRHLIGNPKYREI